MRYSSQGVGESKGTQPHVGVGIPGERDPDMVDRRAIVDNCDSEGGRDEGYQQGRAQLR